MESNSVNVIQSQNTVVVVEPTGNTITVVNNSDSGQITTQNTTFSPTTVVQTTLTLNLDNLPNTVTVINTPKVQSTHT